MAHLPLKQDSEIWSQADWQQLEAQTRRQALAANAEEAAWESIVKQARAVLRTYSTSFFVVTRFLPAHKRAQVEAIYAAVRYPDEIVDTFPLTQAQRTNLLEHWAAQYEAALRLPSLRAMLEAGVPVFLASFVKVVQESAIPPQHYRAFLDAMRLDVVAERLS